MYENTKKQGPWGRSLVSLQHDVHCHASCCAGRQESAKIGSTNTLTFVGVMTLVSDRPSESLSRFISVSGHLGVAAVSPLRLCSMSCATSSEDTSSGPTPSVVDHLGRLSLPWTSVTPPISKLCSHGPAA
ncbi:hypothetical protein K456DRAFT_644529 [Colletotrichum gloeosporioides 23]|nr:hypothetical protein K456DRAFT_644529 [Colletotrichum gloeosporioides 23]